MGKENSSVKCVKKRVSKKISVPQFHKNIKSSTPRKLSTNNKSECKEFDEADSLILLNNTKERKKLNGIDERIKLLKTELRSLLVDVKTHKSSNYIIDSSKLVSDTSLGLDGKGGNLEVMKAVENWDNLEKTQIDKNQFKPNFNSSASEFLEWLDKTPDKLGSKSEIEKPEINELLLNSVSQMDLTPVTPETVLMDSFYTDSKIKNSPYKSVLSQQKVEQLLYKSFLIQNSSDCFSSAEAIALELNKSVRKTKQMHDRSRSKKKFKRVPVQKISGRFTQCGVKQRMSYSSNSLSEVEIITLDSSLGNNEIPKSNVECVDLDLSSYDWSEPFDINIDNSDIQVIEDIEEKNVNINYKQLPSDNSDLMESESSACYEKNGKLQPKKIWECPVCFERSKGQEIVATQCGHVFCRKCIDRHISKLRNNCPSCRCDLKHKPFITLFNF